MTDTPAPRRDVVELLVEAHTGSRHALALADSLAAASATEACTQTARTVTAFFDGSLPLHWEDEERSIAPRLRGRHRVVDSALAQMQRDHLALDAPFARLRLLCRLLGADISRLHALRFELASAVRDARARLDAHHALEESILFPALRRLLPSHELDAIGDEMAARRRALAA